MKNFIFPGVQSGLFFTVLPYMTKEVHIFSNGSDAKDFILDEQDAMAAMNRLALCVYRTGFKCKAFNFMDTHVHIFGEGSIIETVSFMSLFEFTTILYLARRPDRNDARFILEKEYIEDERYRRNVAAYVAIQPTKDGKRVQFQDYKFGSSPLYFRTPEVVPVWNVRDGKVNVPIRFDDLAVDEQRALLHSKYKIPGDWLVVNGMVLPSNYIDIQGFESIFGSPNAYRVFTSRITEGNMEVKEHMERARGVSFEEDELRRLCSATGNALFGKKDIRALNGNQRIRLAAEVRRTTGACLSQLARRVHMPKSELEKYLK